MKGCGKERFGGSKDGTGIYAFAGSLHVDKDLEDLCVLSRKEGVVMGCGFSGSPTTVGFLASVLHVERKGNSDSTKFILFG